MRYIKEPDLPGHSSFPLLSYTSFFKESSLKATAILYYMMLNQVHV